MGDFSIKIWLIKYGKGLVAVLASTGLIYTSQYIEGFTLPPEYAFWGGLIGITALQLGNFIKHTCLVE